MFESFAPEDAETLAEYDRADIEEAERQADPTGALTEDQAAAKVAAFMVSAFCLNITRIV